MKEGVSVRIDSCHRSFAKKCFFLKASFKIQSQTFCQTRGGKKNEKKKWRKKQTKKL